MSSKKLNILLRKRDVLIGNLQNIDCMIKGCYCISSTKCGKLNCRCTNGDRHRLERLIWREDGRSISRAVPEKDIEWIKEMTCNHNVYKKLRKQLNLLDQKIAQQMDTLYLSCIKKSKKGRGYLTVEK